MVSVHGFVEAAQHAVGVGTDSNAVKMCSQAIMLNAQSKFCNCKRFSTSHSHLQAFQYHKKWMYYNWTKMCVQ